MIRLIWSRKYFSLAGRVEDRVRVELEIRLLQYAVTEKVPTDSTISAINRMSENPPLINNEMLIFIPRCRLASSH